MNVRQERGRSGDRTVGISVGLLGCGIVCCLLGAAGCHTTPAVTDRNGDGVISVYCLGDSNTDVGKLKTPKWCEMLAAELPTWKFINGGFARAKAAGDCLFCGGPLLGSALAANQIDLVLISLGTNDMNGPPQAVVDALLALRDQAEQSNAEVLIATIPPRFTTDLSLVRNIDSTNDLLTQRVAPNRLIDFFTKMELADYFPEGVHITDSGQRKRADAALRALRNL